jgi:D-3-phosphoglycerate dehydrogenase
MKVLITCPPMLGMIDSLRNGFENKGVEITCPTVVQTLTEPELRELVPNHDGWIIGDDPATRSVFAAGKQGRLKAAVKWGIGVDNIDFAAAGEFGIPIINTPNMFGREVADIAMAYITALARETFLIDRQIRSGNWPKPRGISLKDKTIGLVGFGDIGRNTAKRAIAAEMQIIAYDPAYTAHDELKAVQSETWPNRIEECDFLVLTCSLNEKNIHMLNADNLTKAKSGVRIVNVARGPLIDETALIASLESGKVHSAALDVFEQEPLPMSSPLRSYKKCIFGSHNSSNTTEAVMRTSERARELLFDFLGIK